MIIVILLLILFSIFFAALAITSLICWVSGAIFSWSAVVLVWLILLIVVSVFGGSGERR